MRRSGSGYVTPIGYGEDLLVFSFHDVCQDAFDAILCVAAGFILVSLLI